MACTFSVLTQMPDLIGSSILKSVSLFIWILLFFILIINSKIIINEVLLKVIIFYILFIIFIGIMQIITNREYLKAIGVYPLNVSLFIFFIGYMLSDKLDNIQFKKVITWYSSIVVLVVFKVYLQIKDVLDWSGNFGYAYSEKNSIATIALTVIVSLLIYRNKINVKYKFVLNVTIIFLLFSMVVLKSRATFVSAIMALIVYVLFNKEGYKNTFRIIAITILSIIVIVTNENLYSIIVEKIIFNKMDYTQGYNVYMMTSGRSEHLSIFMQKFSEKPIIGVGYFWLESFPLCMLMQFGIIGCIPMFLIALSPLIWSLKQFILIKKDLNDIITLTMMYSVIFITNGFFEAASPFGPGVKCFVLWLVFGYSLGINNRNLDK